MGLTWALQPASPLLAPNLRAAQIMADKEDKITCRGVAAYVVELNLLATSWPCDLVLGRGRAGLVRVPKVTSYHMCKKLRRKSEKHFVGDFFE